MKIYDISLGLPLLIMEFDKEGNLIYSRYGEKMTPEEARKYYGGYIYLIVEDGEEEKKEDREEKLFIDASEVRELDL